MYFRNLIEFPELFKPIQKRKILNRCWAGLQPKATGPTVRQLGSHCWPYGRVGLCTWPNHLGWWPIAKRNRGALEACAEAATAAAILACAGAGRWASVSDGVGDDGNPT
jgi:hypothetical protein